MSDIPKPRWKTERKPVVTVEPTPMRLVVPDSTDNKNLPVHFTWDGYWIRGEIYPCWESEGVVRYHSKDKEEIGTAGRSKACILFRFLYCWRNRWESRVYFPDRAEYWGEESQNLAKAWELLEPVLKEFIRKHDPDKPYID